ncbi:MAG: SH3 domain-containing protein [Thermoguttaceae bacterium]
MRPLAILLLSCCALASSVAGAETTFPYTARIAADNADLRSGPGRSYYATDRLKRGREVTVYRHDAGGWCAVRPVEGSFSWIAGRNLRMVEEHLATITADDVPARIGSRIGRDCDVIQVRLHKGETVEVLQTPREVGEDGEAWFKVAPPAGEFRWVASEDLDTGRPREQAPATSRQRLSPKEFQAEFAQLELDLSTMVTEPSAAWSLIELRERANWLLDESQTAIERGRARLLANRIARFEDIKQRQEAVLAMRDPGERQERYATRTRPRVTEGRGSQPLFETDSRYDGVGQLTEVASPKPGSPRFALTDASGQVLCYVTPSPGVNLREYLGRQVGVVGTRGYMPEQHVGHIAARHVTLLDGNVLR